MTPERLAQIAKWREELEPCEGGGFWGVYTDSASELLNAIPELLAEIERLREHIHRSNENRYLESPR